MEKCLVGGEGTDHILNEVILPMVGRFRCRQVPSPDTLKELLVSLARYTLVCQPYYGLVEMRGMEAAHGELWRRVAGTLPMELMQMLAPTTEKVLAMVIEPDFKNPEQQQTFDFLRRFVHQLSSDDLGLLERHSVRCKILPSCSTLQKKTR